MMSAVSTIRRVFRVLQTAWSIFGLTLLTLLLTEAGLRLAFGVKDRVSPIPSPDPRIVEAGYGGESWIVGHYRELERLRDRWEPFVYFRQMPVAGRTITVDKTGRRRTWQPPARDGMASRPARILMLGGSSLWGFGARDDRTIPSLVARKLRDRGVEAEVRNLAEIGYVNTQEVIALFRELQSEYRPDLVVFYDGANDTASALLEGEAAVTTNERNRRAEFNLRSDPGRLATTLVGRIVQQSSSFRLARAVGQRLSHRAGAPTGLPSPDNQRSLAAEVVRRYEANIQIVDRLGRGLGFTPLFFWQPLVFDKSSLTPPEQDEVRKWSWASGFFAVVYDQIRGAGKTRRIAGFGDLSRLFASATDLVFIDYCHTTEAANERIAEAMLDPILSALDARRSP